MGCLPGSGPNKLFTHKAWYSDKNRCERWSDAGGRAGRRQVCVVSFFPPTLATSEQILLFASCGNLSTCNKATSLFSLLVCRVWAIIQRRTCHQAASTCWWFWHTGCALFLLSHVALGALSTCREMLQAERTHLWGTKQFFVVLCTQLIARTHKFPG